MRSQLLGVAFATVAVAGPAQHGVPASLLESARLQPIEFAMALAAAQVPAGLELRESDERPFSEPARVDRHGPRTSLGEVVASFNSSHQEYTARLTQDNIVVIRPVKDALSFLDEPSHIRQPSKVAGVMYAAQLVFSAIAPRLAGGIILDSLPDDAIIVLDGSQSRTVIDTLNQIVLQAPGRCWVVKTRGKGNAVRITEYGFIEASGAHRMRGLTYPDR
jgi:hypothetical protein